MLNRKLGSGSNTLFMHMPCMIQKQRVIYFTQCFFRPAYRKPTLIMFLWPTMKRINDDHFPKGKMVPIGRTIILSVKVAVLSFQSINDYVPEIDRSLNSNFTSHDRTGRQSAYRLAIGDIVSYYRI